MKKRLLSVVLLIAFLLCMLPYSVYASETEENVTVSMNEDIVADDGEIEPRDSTVPRRAIVIIPGILGSTLKESSTGTVVWVNTISSQNTKLRLNEDGSSIYNLVSYGDDYGATSIYATLYSRLYTAFSSEFDIIFFDYDWRLDNSVAAQKLETELSEYTDVMIVAHSMGGLVASKFLASSAANRNKTIALITIGTPFLGSAKCINVMETGELVKDANGEYILKDIVKEVSKNSFAAYQLLPTSNYQSLTGYFPVYVGSTAYRNCFDPLAHTDWGQDSNGDVKDMFAVATAFHSSLFVNSEHIIFHDDVTVYRLAGTGLATISKVTLNEDYAVSYLHISAAGDGTVLAKSAGYGTNYEPFNAEHTELVSDDAVIAKVKEIISQETGVSAADAIDATVHAYHTVPSIVYNSRGWIVGNDNRRIVILTDLNSEVRKGEFTLIETANEVYDENGDLVGNAWPLGNTGRVQYVLNNGDYTIVTNSDTRIEYMNNGYYDGIYEFTAEEDQIEINIGGYGIEPQGVDANGVIHTPNAYSQEHIVMLNRDES